MPKTIVIIEDHAMMRHGITNFLKKKSSWEILGNAGSIKDGKKLILEMNPFAAILDINLSDGEGLKLLSDSEIKPLGVKFVVYSFLKSPALVHQCKDAGAAGFVTKSMNEAELLATLENAYAGEEFYAPKTMLEEVEKIDSITAFLTAREKAVYMLVCRGKSDEEIANDLHLSKKTVQNYISRILNKTGVSSKGELALNEA